MTDALIFFGMVALAVVMASWLLLMGQSSRRDGHRPTLNTRNDRDDSTR